MFRLLGVIIRSSSELIQNYLIPSEENKTRKTKALKDTMDNNMLYDNSEYPSTRRWCKG